MDQRFLLYYSEFASQNGTKYRVEILSTTSSNIPVEVGLPADTPIEIEWQGTDKKTCKNR